MDYKKKKCVCVLVLVISFFGLCYSQSLASEKPTESREVTQRLTWEAVEYAPLYEIVIERKVREARWEPYEIHTSEKNEIVLTLPVGTYRYNIVVYNVLNRKEEPSDWYEFTVHRALQPKVNRIMPEEIHLNSKTDGIIVVVADNIVYNSVFTLTHPDGTVLFGAIVHTDEDSTVLDFDEHRLLEGDYTLSVDNPGGLKDASQVLTVKKERTFDILFSGGYTATTLLPGGTIVNQLTSTFLPLGFNFQVDYVPIKKSFGDIGFGIAMHSLVLQQPIENYTVSGYIFPVSIHTQYTYPLIEEKFLITAYAGAGLTFLSNLYIHEKGVAQKDPLDAIGVTPMVGTSLQLYTGNMVYFDVALNYYCSIFVRDTFMQMLLPSISVGLKF